MLKLIKRWLGIKSPSEVYGKAFACYFGLHNWQPTGDAVLVWHSKWDAYHATPVECDNCGKPAEKREEYYW